jgi:hypothetical protein
VSPASGAPAAELDPGGRRRPGRAKLLARAASAPVLLAATTLAAVASAVLALLPAAVRRRPAGRAEARGGAEAAAPDPASEPVAR